MRMIYQFRSGSRLSGDAQQVGEKLHEIRRRYKSLTPARIVESAMPVKSILHQYFEWDNKRAASEYRLHQARHLVACVVTVQADGEETKPVRSFVSVNHTYEPIEVVLSDTAMRERVLKEIMQAISSMKEKLRSYEELHDVLDALNQAQKAASSHFIRKARKAGETKVRYA